MEPSKIKTKRKTVIVLSLIVLVGLSVQLTSPKISNPPVTSNIKVPDDVSAVLRKGCYDCHSNESKLSWFDKIAPVSWIVSADIKKARSRFNLSQWNDLGPADQQVKFWEMINMAENGKMPLPGYLRFHPNAKLNKRDIQVLKKFAQTYIISKAGDTVEINRAEKEFKAYSVSTGENQKSPVSLNGIKYSGNYKNWKVIAATTRFENGTMRIIYGNDIAVTAIEQGEIDPWPQGSVLVKVVWDMIEDKDGNIRPGTFNNTQWMIKNDRQFPDTRGWGFARFNGINLLPYGKTASFGTACFNCHKLVKETGYVFDLPVKN